MSTTIKFETKPTDISSYKFNENQFEIYPIPCTDILYLKQNNPVNSELNILLYNTQGECIKNISKLFAKENVLKIDCTEIPDGFYFVKITGENINSFNKIVKLK